MLRKFSHILRFCLFTEIHGDFCRIGHLNFGKILKLLNGIVEYNFCHIEKPRNVLVMMIIIQILINSQIQPKKFKLSETTCETFYKC